MKKFLTLLILFFACNCIFAQTINIISGKSDSSAQTKTEGSTETEFEKAHASLREAATKSIRFNQELLVSIGFKKDILGDGKFIGVSYYYWLGSLILFVIYAIPSFLFVKIIFGIVLRHLHNKNIRIAETVLESIKKPVRGFTYALVTYVSLQMFAWELDLLLIFQSVFRVIFLFYFFWFLLKIYDAFAHWVRSLSSGKSGYKEIVPMFTNAIRWILVLCAALYVASSIGLNVSGIIVSLGIGGAALAFASKDTIANFFGSISLIMDAPFKIGDRIQIGTKCDGTVESIGIRSTRVRNLDRTLSILPNSYLANEYITNVTKWEKRRTVQDIGLVYETKPAQIKNIMSDIEKLLKSDKRIDADNVIVAFEAFDESSLRVKVVYFTYDLDGKLYFKLLTDMNYAIMEIVEKNGSSFAFPTRTVHMQK